MPKLITILEDLVSIGQDELRLSDGAVTWKVWCLRDEVRMWDNDEEPENYSWQSDGIWSINDDGYLDKLIYGIEDDDEQ